LNISSLNRSNQLPREDISRAKYITEINEAINDNSKYPLYGASIFSLFDRKAFMDHLDPTQNPIELAEEATLNRQRCHKITQLSKMDNNLKTNYDKLKITRTVTKIK
jgi:hypothetical protein